MGNRAVQRPEGVHALAPDGYLAVDLDGAELLAGPAGAFLIAVSSDPAAIERLATRAGQVRRLMGNHLQWVPFVHPIVLSDTPLLVPRAVNMTADQLRRRMISGRPCIEPETLDKIREMVERRILHRSAFEAHSAGCPAAQQ